MFPILYDKDETEFTSRGLGTLIDAILCDVTEERNGEYELKLVYPIDGLHYDEIDIGCYIKAKANDVSANLQVFRIYDIEKDLGNKVTILAEHISYLLNGFPVPSMTISNRTIVEAFSDASAASDALFGNTAKIKPSSFEFTTRAADGSNFASSTYNFDIKKPRGIRALLGGEENSFLDKVHGEYEFDNFTVILHKKRGSDNGIKIVYGKNLVGFKMENDDNSCYSHILPYAVYYVETTVNGQTEQEERIIYSGQNGAPELMALSSLSQENESTVLRVKPIDLSEQFSEGEEITSAKVKTKADTYISNRLTELCKITESIDVTYQPFGRGYGTEKMVSVDQVGLCDDVTVIFPRFGISKTLRVNKTIYNALLEKYKSIEIGTPKGNFGDTIKNEIVN